MKRLTYLVIIAIAVVILGQLLSGYKQTAITSNLDDLVIRNGTQFVKLTAVDNGYLEQSIHLQKDIPAQLTIFGQTYGCASAIVARDFWSGIRMVSKGNIETVNFTPTKTGTFKGSCAMGMYNFNFIVT